MGWSPCSPSISIMKYQTGILWGLSYLNNLNQSLSTFPYFEKNKCPVLPDLLRFSFKNQHLTWHSHVLNSAFQTLIYMWIIWAHCENAYSGLMGLGWDLRLITSNKFFSATPAPKWHRNAGRAPRPPHLDSRSLSPFNPNASLLVLLSNTMPDRPW